SRNTEDRIRATGRRAAGFGFDRLGAVRFRCRLLPSSSPRTALLANVPVEIVSEIFERALQRLHRSRRKRTEGISRRKKFSLKPKRLQVTLLAMALLHRQQNLFPPGEAAP